MCFPINARSVYVQFMSFFCLIRFALTTAKLRDHPFSMYEKFSEILIFFPLIHRRRNVSFWENFAYIPNGWFLTRSLREKCPNTEFFWSVFSRIRIDYGEMLRITPYSVRMRENMDQKKHFSRIGLHLNAVSE